MTVRIPEFTKCFGCLPLRWGLIVWGYVKLVFNFLFILQSGLVSLLMRPQSVGLLDVLYLTIYTLILLCDASFTILLIVAGHKKSVKLMHMTYVYNIVWIVMCSLKLCWYIYRAIYFIYLEPGTSSHIYKTYLTDSAVYFVILVLQCYIVLLIRSEVRKLQKEEPTRVTNKMADKQLKFPDSAVKIC